MFRLKLESLRASRVCSKVPSGILPKLMTTSVLHRGWGGNPEHESSQHEYKINFLLPILDCYNVCFKSIDKSYI